MRVGAGDGARQVIADFDRTLTMARVASGERGDSCHGVMESLSVLSDEYKAATTALLDHYYPIEICSERTREQKLPLMQEWCAARELAREVESSSLVSRGRDVPSAAGSMCLMRGMCRCLVYSTQSCVDHTFMPPHVPHIGCSPCHRRSRLQGCLAV